LRVVIISAWALAKKRAVTPKTTGNLNMIFSSYFAGNADCM
jgi:hypothetical protein